MLLNNNYFILLIIIKNNCQKKKNELDAKFVYGVSILRYILIENRKHLDPVSDRNKYGPI